MYVYGFYLELGKRKKKEKNIYVWKFVGVTADSGCNNAATAPDVYETSEKPPKSKRVYCSPPPPVLYQMNWAK